MPALPPFYFCVGHAYAPKSGPARLMVSSFWVCVIVLVATYNAKLFSFLAMEEHKLPFTTLTGALKAKGVEFYVERTQVGRSLLEVNISRLPFRDMSLQWRHNEPDGV